MPSMCFPRCRFAIRRETLLYVSLTLGTVVIFVDKLSLALPYFVSLFMTTVVLPLSTFLGCCDGFILVHLVLSVVELKDSSQI